ncbi:MAG: P-type conjugative transfer protein TrbJ [Pseudomonadota bacterium]
MNRIFFSAIMTAFSLAPFTAPPASAQLVTYDPANHIQSIIQAVQAVESVTYQIEQLANEIEMLENMARNLETLPVHVAEGLIRERIARIRELMARAEGIGYSVEEIEEEYEEVYPETYGDTPPDSAVLVEEARQRWQQSRTAYRQTLIVSAGALEDNETDAAAISELVAASQSAVGNLQAAQAGNQIEAIQTEQLMQIEAIMAAHYRAEALERARQLAEEERARARLINFLGDDSAYTPGG